jgi:hypothetical protein
MPVRGLAGIKWVLMVGIVYIYTCRLPELCTCPPLSEYWQVYRGGKEGQASSKYKFSKKT